MRPAHYTAPAWWWSLGSSDPDVRPKVVSERLGHATVGITLDTCSHVLPNMQEEAARKIDSLLARARGRHRDPE